MLSFDTGLYSSHISHLLTVSCSNFICWMSFTITAKRSLCILYILACACWIVWAAKTLVRTTRERDGDCGISGREWQRGKKSLQHRRKTLLTPHSTSVQGSGYVGDARNACRDWDASKGTDAIYNYKRKYICILSIREWTYYPLPSISHVLKIIN
jgi:hypothetical protein